MVFLLGVPQVIQTYPNIHIFINDSSVSAETLVISFKLDTTQKIQQTSPPAMLGHKQMGTSINQEESSYQELTKLAPLSQTFSFQNCEEINFCCLSDVVCGILLCKPGKTNTSCMVRRRTRVAMVTLESELCRLCIHMIFFSNFYLNSS